MDTEWYPVERFRSDRPPPNQITTLVDIQEAGELASPPQAGNRVYIPDKIDALCEWMSGLPEFYSVDNFIRRGRLLDDFTRVVLLVQWTLPDQPPPNLVELIHDQLEPKPPSVTVTDLVLDRRPYSSQAHPFEVARWRLPRDHQNAEKKVVFDKAFADICMYSSDAISGRDAHEGNGDVTYFMQGWCLRRRSTAGEDVNLGEEYYFIHIFDNEDGEQRYKDPSRENYFSDMDADLYESGFERPVKDMEKLGMVPETLSLSLTGNCWIPKRCREIEERRFAEYTARMALQSILGGHQAMQDACRPQ